MKILILEDDPVRFSLMEKFLQRVDNIAITHVETSKEAIDHLAENTYDIVSLDHDLGGTQLAKSGPGTGFEVARWLANNEDRQPPQIWLHSLNPVGRMNMKYELPDAFVCPSWWLG